LACGDGRLLACLMGWVLKFQNLITCSDDSNFIQVGYQFYNLTHIYDKEKKKTLEPTLLDAPQVPCVT
jgi:hypothetical protein